jgi:hypothetical protein
VGEVSVVLLPLSIVLLLASKATVVVLCNRKVVVDVNFKKRQLRIYCSKTTQVVLLHVILTKL